jgi:hypothetical protein
MPRLTVQLNPMRLEIAFIQFPQNFFRELFQPLARAVDGGRNLRSENLSNYSVITRSAHSTNDTKIAGLPNLAFH